MINNTNKEQWITNVLDSTKGMVHAEPKTDIYEQVFRKLAAEKAPKNIAVPIKQWAVAAVILLTLNIGSVLYALTQDTPKEQTATINPLAAEMQAGTMYNY